MAAPGYNVPPPDDRTSINCLHCGKAIKRSQLWDPTKHVKRGDLPSLGRILHDQACAPDMSAEELDARIEERHEKRLY